LIDLYTNAEIAIAAFQPKNGFNQPLIYLLLLAGVVALLLRDLVVVDAIFAVTLVNSTIR
jgi:hypothetical protein